MANPLSSNIGTPTNINSAMLNNMNPGIQQLKGMMNMLKTSSNPQMLIQQMIQSNPQLAQVANLVNGRNPEAVFRDMCNQRGINPDEFINMLK